MQGGIMDSSVSKVEIRSDIQGLRAVAVLAVVLFHAEHSWLPGGYLGVDLFFLISGFLISGIIIKKCDTNVFDFVEFFYGRAMRILPAYIVMLVVISTISAIFLLPNDFKDYSDSLKYALNFNANNYFSNFGGYFSPKSYELPLAHTWSLSVEMQFYAILPLILYFSSKKSRIYILSLMVISSFFYGFLLMNYGEEKGAYYSLFVRIFEFIFGGLAFLIIQKRNKLIGLSSHLNALGLFLIVILFFIPEQGKFQWLIMLAIVVGGVLIICFDGYSSRVLSSPILVWIGGISYSLYLWHWPIFSLLRYIYQSDSLPLLVLLVSILFAFILAELTKINIEDRFRKKEGGANFVGLVKISLLISCGWGAFFTTPALNAKFDSNLPIEMTRYSDPELICHGKTNGDCLRGDKNSNQKPILVLGDSHAAQLNLTFDQIGTVNHRLYRVITGSSCVTIPQFDSSKLPDWAKLACSNSIEFAKKYIAESDTIIVAGMWEYQLQNAAFLPALHEFINLNRDKKKVIVLSQVPMLDSNPVRVARFNNIGINVRSKLNQDAINANLKVQGMVNSNSGLFLDLTYIELFNHAPFYNGKLIYRDESHLNEVGANLYSDFLQNKLSGI